MSGVGDSHSHERCISYENILVTSKEGSDASSNQRLVENLSSLNHNLQLLPNHEELKSDCVDVFRRSYDGRCDLEPELVSPDESATASDHLLLHAHAHNSTTTDNDTMDSSLVCPSPPPPGALQRAPSQVTMHYTTVPQSLVSRQLGTRHHPTRSSLRRSRLLVLVKNGTVPRKYLPGVVEKEKLGVGLNLTQLVLGILATALAVWRIVACNNMSRQEDWPYYSGLMMILSGWFGLILLLNCRYLYPGVAHHPCIFPIRTYHIISCVVLSSLGGVSCLVSAICYCLHIITYSYSNCQNALITEHWSVETCVCLSTTQLWRNGELVYPSTSCNKVNEVVPAFLWSLLLINIISFFSALGFLSLLTSSHHVRTFKNWRQFSNTKNKQTDVAKGVRGTRGESPTVCPSCL